MIPKLFNIVPNIDFRKKTVYLGVYKNPFQVCSYYYIWFLQEPFHLVLRDIKKQYEYGGQAKNQIWFFQSLLFFGVYRLANWVNEQDNNSCGYKMLLHPLLFVFSLILESSLLL